MTAEEIFAAIVRKRGIADLDSFISPDYSNLGDPYLLPDMEAAVARIKIAKNRGEKIGIYGDYDVDGLSATALLVDAFKAMGFAVEAYIPDRFEDGYGLSERGIKALQSKGVSLIITVDTGSLAHSEVNFARKQDIDVIVTDHHSVGDSLPSAIAVINPKRADSAYPYNQLAGVGVAFSLVRALQKTSFGLAPGKEKWLLDLVAMGTVCDIVPLIEENRILVYFGLRVLKVSRRHGIHELARIAGIDLDKITTEKIGFQLGPRLNAAGRITHGQQSLELLLADETGKAQKYARILNELNQKRQHKQQIIYDQAIKMVEGVTDKNIHFFVHSDWSHGIAGIVAAKLVEELQKPVFVLQQQNDVVKGSGRSIAGFNLAEAIEANRSHLIKGGGHAQAAGITIESSHLDSFDRAMNEYFKKHNLQQDDENRLSYYDVGLSTFEGINYDLIQLINQLAPFGEANQIPTLKFDKVELVEWRAVGRDFRHAKALVRDVNGMEFKAIGFSKAKHMPEPGSIVSITTKLYNNVFNGTENLELNIEDIARYNS